METMLFSIIVPVYNVQDYLPICMKSLLNQKGGAYEVILVDDGSTDHSGVLCDRYAKEYENVKAFHKCNGGLSDARNFGVKNSTGKYIIFVDSDDFVSEDMIFMFGEVIKKDESVDMITSDGKYLVYKNAVVSSVTSNFRMELNGLNGEDALLKILKLYYDDWNAWGKCFKRKFLEQNKFEFKKGRLSEDVELIYKVYIKAQKVAVINTFYYYRQARDGSIIASQNPQLIKDTILNLTEWNDYLQTAEISNELKQLLYERFAMQYCTSVLSAVYSFSGNDRISIKKEAENIRYWLNKSNKKYVRTIRCLESLVGMNLTLSILHKIRIFNKLLLRLNWELHAIKISDRAAGR